MARNLGISPSDFTERFAAKPVPREKGQFFVEAKSGRACPLFSEEQGCRVELAKPLQCRAFPFWEELLDDRTAWNQAKQECEGIDHPLGHLYTADEVRSIRDGRRGT